MEGICNNERRAPVNTAAKMNLWGKLLNGGCRQKDAQLLKCIIEWKHLLPKEKQECRQPRIYTKIF